MLCPLLLLFLLAVFCIAASSLCAPRRPLSRLAVSFRGQPGFQQRRAEGSRGCIQRRLEV
jgi:hypothetical protein